MSLKDVKLELDEIELQQQGLEKQGVRLEQLIRSKCESGSRINGNYVYHLCMIFIYVSKYVNILYIHLRGLFISRKKFIAIKVDTFIYIYKKYLFSPSVSKEEK